MIYHLIHPTQQHILAYHHIKIGILKSFSKYYIANKVQIKYHWDSGKTFILAYLHKTQS